jgi:SNF family Na+-dependent transporter
VHFRYFATTKRKLKDQTRKRRYNDTEEYNMFAIKLSCFPIACYGVELSKKEDNMIKSPLFVVCVDFLILLVSFDVIFPQSFRS